MNPHKFFHTQWNNAKREATSPSLGQCTTVLARLRPDVVVQKKLRFFLTVFSKRFGKYPEPALQGGSTRVSDTTQPLFADSRLRKCLDVFAFDTRDLSVSKKRML